MSIKFIITNIDGAEFEFYFFNCLRISKRIFKKILYYIGNLVNLMPNIVLDVQALIKRVLFKFQRTLYAHFAYVDFETEVFRPRVGTSL